MVWPLGHRAETNPHSSADPPHPSSYHEVDYQDCAHTATGTGSARRQLNHVADPLAENEHLPVTPSSATRPSTTSSTPASLGPTAMHAILMNDPDNDPLFDTPSGPPSPSTITPDHRARWSQPLGGTFTPLLDRLEQHHQQRRRLQQQHHPHHQHSINSYPSPSPSQGDPQSPAYIPSAQPLNTRFLPSPQTFSLTNHESPSPSPPTLSPCISSFSAPQADLSLRGGSPRSCHTSSSSHPRPSSSHHRFRQHSAKDLPLVDGNGHDDDDDNASMLDAVLEGIGRVYITMNQDQAGRWRISRPPKEDVCQYG